MPALVRLGLAAAQASGSKNPQGLEDVFSRATARPEDRSRIAAATQTFDRAEIERSSARSVTDLLAEHAVGFLSENGRPPRLR